jgi:hypothetical protein
VTPAKRGKGSDKLDLKSKKNAEPTVGEHKEMSWAQRLKRVFNIHVTICSCCGGAVKIIVEASNRCIEDPLVIKKILVVRHPEHPDAKSGASASANQLPEPRAPPQTRLFD